MRRLLPALGALLFATAAAALEPSPAGRASYAFDYPRILAQQKLFGVAHGVALLAAACRTMPAADPAAEAAYAAWRARQRPAIAAAVSDLSLYYFGNGIAPTQALVQKLGLKEDLGHAPQSAELRSACATLPKALRQPRYDLIVRLRLEELMARIVAATETEARERHCRDLFSAPQLKLHQARYATWREINDAVLAQAKTALAAAWPVDAPAATFSDWYANLQRTTHAGGSLGDCVAFSESLKRPETALLNVFRMPSIHLDKNPQ